MGLRGFFPLCGNKCRERGLLSLGFWFNGCNHAPGVFVGNSHSSAGLRKAGREGGLWAAQR